MENLEKEHIRAILMRLSRDYYDHLMFAGIVDEEAKLIDYQKGLVSPFQLPNARQNVLDIQVSLIFALAKQFEDFTGSLAHMVLTYDDYEVIIMDISAGTILYVICTTGAASDFIDALLRMAEDTPVGEAGGKGMIAGHNQDLVRNESSGQ